MKKTSSLDKLGLIIEQDVNLSKYTTFQLGGPSLGLIHCSTPFELEKAITYLNDKNKKFIIIGGGSNLVVSDHGLDCYVIRYVTKTPLIERDGNNLIVSGSTKLDVLSLFAAQSGLAGLLCATGIPGTVGGAILGNAGAFGRQIGDVVKHVDVITFKGEKKRLTKEQLGFSYRNSILKQTKDIVVSVCLGLEICDEEILLADRGEVLNIRKEKHPDLKDNPCAGSFFRNIESTSNAGRRQAAGWFLEEAGAKNLKYGGAALFEKHANIIVKSENCTAQDVFALSQRMQRVVKKKFDLDLVREVRFVGEFFGKPSQEQDLIW
jgi:UDP-N-acetylmuramate dehydrogenase